MINIDHIGQYTHLHVNFRRTNMFTMNLAKTGTPAQESAISKFTAKITEELKNRNDVSDSITGTMMARESASPTDIAEITTASESIAIAINAASTDMNEYRVSTTGEELSSQALAYENAVSKPAAMYGAALGANPSKAVGAGLALPEAANGRDSIISGGTASTRSLASEYYDQRANSNLVETNLTYNYLMTDVHPLVKMFYPPIVQDPAVPGFKITGDLIYIYEDKARELHGRVTNWKKRPVTRAAIDSSILNNKKLPMIPVLSPDSEHLFVDVADYLFPDELVDGETVATGALKVKEEIGFIELSQTQAVLSKGNYDLSDSLDFEIYLQDIFVNVGDDRIKMPVVGLESARYMASQQGSSTGMELSFLSNDIVLNKDSKNFDDTDFADLAIIKTKELTVRISAELSGRMDLGTSTGIVFASKTFVSKVFDVNNKELPLDTGDGKDVVDAYNAVAEIVGYSLEAYRTNLNHRRRGKLVVRETISQTHYVKTGEPLTVLRPIDQPAGNKEIQELVALGNTRMANDAIDQMLRDAEVLRVAAPLANPNEITGILGMGNLYVKPTFVSRDVNLMSDIDVRTSHERRADIQAVLVNNLRQACLDMYIESGYEAADTVLNGGVASKPTFGVLTTSTIAMYLYESGDERLGTDKFNIRVVTHPNEKIEGKMLIAPVVYNDTRNSAPNPLASGVTPLYPEGLYNINITRNGAHNAEVTTYSRVKHINMCPVMGEVLVSNIDLALKALN